MTSARSQKVLIAGGTKMMQLSLAQLFQGDRYQLIFSDAAEDTISKVISINPDLALLDMSMPGSNGLDVIKRIRSFTSDMKSVVQANDVAIVAICGNEKEDPFAREAQRMHLAAVFCKPFSLNKLGDKIKELLAVSGEGRQASVRTILVVENEPRVRLLYESIFADTVDCDVVTVEDAIHALEQVEFRTLDLIITEQNLPDMTGIEFVKSLQEIGKNIPVIIVSSAGSEELIKEAKSLGVRHYVVKPFVIDKLKRLVKDTLQGTGQHGAVPSESVINQ